MDRTELSKKIILISHTPYSFRYFPKGTGEVQNSLKLRKLLHQSGYAVSKVFDCFQLFGGINKAKREIKQLACLNEQLSRYGYEPLDGWGSKVARSLYEKVNGEVVSSPSGAVTMVLSNRDQISAFIGVGVPKLAPFVAKYYLPRAGLDFSWSKIWSRADLIVTECLYNCFGAFLIGISPMKMIYLPHHYPQESDHLFQMEDLQLRKSREKYIRKLAERNQKKVVFNAETLLVGIVSRLCEGKNVEYVVEAFEEIAAKGINAILILKGGYDQQINGTSSYKRKMSALLSRVQKAPWFLWDSDFEAFPKVLKTYRIFDLCVMQSSIEGASNVLVELASLGRPCLLLKEHSNPFLFEGGVEWVEPKLGIHTNWRAPRRPNQAELRDKLEQLLKNGRKRRELGQQARAIAISRFSPERTLERMPLLLAAASSFFHRDNQQKLYQKQIFQLFIEDLQRYQIPFDITVDQILKTQYVGANLPLFNQILPKIPKEVFPWGSKEMQFSL